MVSATPLSLTAEEVRAIQNVAVTHIRKSNIRRETAEYVAGRALLIETPKGFRMIVVPVHSKKPGQRAFVAFHPGSKTILATSGLAKETKGVFYLCSELFDSRGRLRVSHEHYRKGIGSALLSLVLDNAKKLKATEVRGYSVQNEDWLAYLKKIGAVADNNFWPNVVFSKKCFEKPAWKGRIRKVWRLPSLRERITSWFRRL